MSKCIISSYFNFRAMRPYEPIFWVVANMWLNEGGIYSKLTPCFDNRLFPSIFCIEFVWSYGPECSSLVHETQHSVLQH